MIQPDANPDDGGEAVHSSLPPAEQITHPSHDDEGLIERLDQLGEFYRYRPVSTDEVPALEEITKRETADLFALLDQAANTISRLKGERDDLSDRIIPGLNKQLTEQFELSTKFAARSLQLEAEIKELRSGLEKSAVAHEKLLRSWMYAPFPKEAQALGGMSPPSGPFALAAEAIQQARSLLSPSQDVGLSSARSSRDARSSTRPEGPCSDEGER